MPVKEFPYTASTQIKNRNGFGVLTSGIKLDNYKKNPIVLKNHNADEPVGTSKDLKFSVNEATVVVAIDDTDDPAFQKLNRDIEKKLWEGLSLGLNPDWNKIQYGVEGFDPEVPVFMESELLELSITPVPANGDCLRLKHNGEWLDNEQVKIKLCAISNSNSNKENPMSKLLLMATALGLSAAATEDEVLTKLQSQANENKTLKEKLEKIETDKAEALKLSAATLVDDAVKANKITAEKKEQYLKLALADYDSTKSILDNITPYKSATAQLSGLGNGASAEGEDPTAKYTFKDFQTKAPKLLLAMKTEDPDRWRKLFNEQYGTNKK